LALWAPLARPAAVAQAGPAAALQAAPEPLPSAIDFSRLDEYFGDDPDVIKTLLDAFCSSTGPELERLHSALRTRDRPAVEALAHEIKGTCGNLGVDGMAQLAGLLEAEVERGHWAQALDLLGQLQQLFVRVQQAIHERLGNA
jgi:two-component system sensor histidine kinase/response regulator